jgi:hypothetical protein
VFDVGVEEHGILEVLVLLGRRVDTEGLLTGLRRLLIAAVFAIEDDALDVGGRLDI